MTAPDVTALTAWLDSMQAEVERDHRPNAGMLSTSCYCDVPEPCEDRIDQLAAIESLHAILTRSAELVAENMRMHRELAAALDGNQRLQTMNEGLRQMAIQAREAAEGWHRATIELYSGREEAAPQQPKTFAEDCDCGCQPGQPCLCPERDCYCGPCRVCDRDEDKPPASEPMLTDRQAALLAAIRHEGNDWSPLRARAALMSAGYAVESNRAAQIMKGLAAYGFLEPVRPRAQTYRLVAPQQPAQTPEAPQCSSHAHPDFVEDPTIRCELPDGHAWHRNGERTWTP